MADPVPPVSPVAAAQAVRRGRALVVLERREEPSEEAAAEEPRSAVRPPRPGSVSAVGAQLLGEKPRRGLRAGPEVLEQARSTYLSNEFSGSRDRRPRKGQLTKTEI